MRDIRELINTFYLIYDQYGREEGILESEVCIHLNNGLTHLMDDVFYPDKKKPGSNQFPPYGFEHTQFNQMDFEALILKIELDPSSDGIIDKDDIRANFPTTYVRDSDNEIIDERQCEVFHYASMERWDGSDWQPVQWQRWNEFSTDKKNPFRVATDAYPVFSEYDKSLYIQPEGTNRINMYVVHEHPYLWYNPSNAQQQVDFMLNNRVAMATVFRALSLAGVSVRDQELYRMVENEQMKT